MSKEQWGNGFHAGFNEGRESLFNEGWKFVKSIEDIKIGDTVKLMVKSMSGWKGIGKVEMLLGGIIIIRNKFTDEMGEILTDTFIGTVFCCPHELMVLYKR
jgi:hypothetical protein